MAQPHVSQENGNAIENLQMHEHPDRWGGWRSLRARPKPADSEAVQRKLSYQHMQLHQGIQDSSRGLWNGAALAPTRDYLLN